MSGTLHLVSRNVFDGHPHQPYALVRRPRRLKLHDSLQNTASQVSCEAAACTSQQRSDVLTFV